MPSTSKKQQRFFFAELSRAQRGMKTQTGLGLATIKEFTHLKKKKKKKHE